MVFTSAANSTYLFKATLRFQLNICLFIHFTIVGVSFKGWFHRLLNHNENTGKA